MHTTTTKLVTTGEAAATVAPIHPVLQFRLPKPREVDPWFGANRSFYNEHILPTPRNGWAPPIHSRVIRKPGAKKAVRFIIYASAAEFFRKLDETTAREMEQIRAHHAGSGETGPSSATNPKGRAAS